MKKKILMLILAVSLSGIPASVHAVSNTSNTLSNASNTLSNTSSTLSNASSNASDTLPDNGFVVPNDIKTIDKYTEARENTVKSGRINVTMSTSMSAEGMVIENTALSGTADFKNDNSHIKMASQGIENEMYVVDNVSYMQNPETKKWEKMTLADIKTGSLSETLMEKPVIAKLLTMEKGDDSSVILKNTSPVPLKVYLNTLQGGETSPEGMPEPEGQVDIEIKITKDNFIESIKIDIVSENDMPGGPSSMNINFLKTFKDFGTAPEIVLPEDVKNAEEYNPGANTPAPSSNTSNTLN